MDIAEDSLNKFKKWYYGQSEFNEFDYGTYTRFSPIPVSNPNYILVNTFYDFDEYIPHSFHVKLYTFNTRKCIFFTSAGTTDESKLNAESIYCYIENNQDIAEPISIRLESFSEVTRIESTQILYLKNLLIDENLTMALPDLLCDLREIIVSYFGKIN